MPETPSPPATPPAALTARVEVFRPGTFRPMAGDPIRYSAADLRAIADAYDFATAPAPVVVGHPETDAPAYGWIESFDYDAASERLFANLTDIDPAFAELVKAGRYRKVSMAYFSPSQPHNPVPGTWYPKHLGFLGAAAPAVSGLKNASFAGPAHAVFTASFGDPAAEETAGILRALREFFIDRFGLEDADRALPSWRIEWLGQMPGDSPAPTAAAYAAEPAPTKESVPVTQADPAFAAREAEIAAREARIATREAEIAHAANVAFAERLVEEGRLLPVSRDRVVAILDALPGGVTVSFAAGEAPVPTAEALRAVLEAQPKVVTFGALALEDDQAQGGAAFAADGRAVDPARLELHRKAEAYQRANPGTAYAAAVKAVS